VSNITVDARMINSSGIGTVIKNILKRMIVLKPEWNFFILGDLLTLKKYNFLKCDNVKLISCNAPIYSIKEQIELVKRIPKDTDIMWSPHYNIPIFYKGKLIVTIHDVFHLAMPQFVKGMHKQLYARFMFNMVKYKANKIICVSNFTASELEKYVSIDKNKVEVVYNGIDKEWFNVNLEKPVYDKPYLLYVGNVKPHKNLVNLVKAFELIKDKIPHDLIIVGKKEGFITGDKNIFKLTKKMSDRIIFTGYIDDNLLKQYYKQADLFIFPSLYEGFGLPPLEALATGTRVICSDILVLKEICKNMVDYFEPLDIESISRCIIKNINNKKNDSIINFYDYNWNICVRKYIEVIESII
jgi:glycosyltransferase involved in cell wall biosynthesis